MQTVQKTRITAYTALRMVEFTSDMTMEEMMSFCIDKMVEVHPEIDEKQASAMMMEVFPKLKRWASD
jgi:hypothetical protein